MKTKMNLNQIAQMSFASAALFFFAGVMPLQAETKSISASNQELADAAFRLDNLNNKIEASIRFVAPTVSSNDDFMAMEAEAAAVRLENLNMKIQKAVKFEAPAVNVNAEALENDVNQSINRLNNLNLAIEDSIRFQAPATDEAAGAF